MVFLPICLSLSDWLKSKRNLDTLLALNAFSLFYVVDLGEHNVSFN